MTRDGASIGIGSGSTVVYAVDHLVDVCRKRSWHVYCVPTSFQSRQLIIDASDVLHLTDLARHPHLDVVIDGADECDECLHLIKGGGACQTLEKLVASCTTNFIIIADYRKDSRRLGQQWLKGIPVEVIPQAYVVVMERMRALKWVDGDGDGDGGDGGVGTSGGVGVGGGVGAGSGGRPTLRMATSKAGPIVTDNGNFIIDVIYDDVRMMQSSHLSTLATTMGMWPGVLDTGLFCHMAVQAYFGQADGSVVMRRSGGGNAGGGGGGGGDSKL